MADSVPGARILPPILFGATMVVAFLLHWVRPLSLVPVAIVSIVRSVGIVVVLLAFALNLASASPVVHQRGVIERVEHLLERKFGDEYQGSRSTLDLNATERPMWAARAWRARCLPSSRPFRTR